MKFQQDWIVNEGARSREPRLGGFRREGERGGGEGGPNFKNSKFDP